MMLVTVNGKAYCYHQDFQGEDTLRSQMNALAGQTFQLSFESWYQQGYWGEKCMPHGLFLDGKCVSNVFANLFEVDLYGDRKRYIQLGTVMTDPEYRGKGLSRFLMEQIINQWKNNCDGIYLYANDSVTEFYPKFGFAEEQEYRYSAAVTGKKGNVRKLNLDLPEDRALLLQKCGKTPFAAVSMRNSTEITMFHCLLFLRENLYYLPDYDAVAVAETEGACLYCMELFSQSGNGLKEILAILAGENCCQVNLGFTPGEQYGFVASPHHEEDTHLFVYQEKENPFHTGKLMFPVLSHT